MTIWVYLVLCVPHSGFFFLMDNQKITAWMFGHLPREDA